MAKGKSKPEFYILFDKGLTTKDLFKLFPDSSKSMIYYYGRRHKEALTRLITLGILGADFKLKVVKSE